MRFNFKTMSEKEIINKWVLTGWSLMAVFLSGAYGVKGYIMNQNNLIMTTIIVVALIIPLLFGIYIFSKDRKSKVIQRLMPISYGIALFAIMGTSKTPMTFLYCIPIMLLIVAYNNSRLMTLTMGVLWFGCVLSFVWCKMIKRIWELSLDETLIYFIVLPMMCVFAIISTVLAERTNKNKLQRTKEQTEKISEIVSTATEIAGQVNVNATNSTDKLVEMSGSTESMTREMEETMRGMENVRGIIDEQMRFVSEIELQTEQVLAAVNNIATETENSNREFDAAKHQMELLLENSNQMGITAKETMNGVSRLNEIIGKVSAIVGIISEISGQTELLSLNASIEAARAGEKGRGFSVVATEIGKLAAQTGKATTDISGMINTLTQEFDNMKASTSSLIQIGEQQKNSITNVDSSFERCKQCISNIIKSADNQNLAMNSLSYGNKKLATAIEDLNAVDEEVFANALSTSELAKSNANLVDIVKQYMCATSENVVSLKETLTK